MVRVRAYVVRRLRVHSTSPLVPTSSILARGSTSRCSHHRRSRWVAAAAVACSVARVLSRRRLRRTSNTTRRTHSRCHSPRRVRCRRSSCASARLSTASTRATTSHWWVLHARAHARTHARNARTLATHARSLTTHACVYRPRARAYPPLLLSELTRARAARIARRDVHSASSLPVSCCPTAHHSRRHSRAPYGCAASRCCRASSAGAAAAARPQAEAAPAGAAAAARAEAEAQAEAAVGAARSTWSGHVPHAR
jgi:hypothetical protein